MSSKPDRSQKLSILYCLFVLLYTVYIACHVRSGHRGAGIWYYIKFQLICGIVYFTVQRLLLRSGDWILVLLLSPAILILTIMLIFLLSWIIGWGGGDLLKHDAADIITACLIFLALSIYSLRFLGSKRK